jgi:hypothetical protein
MTLVPLVAVLLHSSGTNADHTLRRKRSIVALDNGNDDVPVNVNVNNEQSKMMVDNDNWGRSNLEGTKSSDKAIGQADTGRRAKAAKSASTKSSHVKSSAGANNYSKDTKTKAAGKKEGAKLWSAEGKTDDLRRSKAETKSGSKADTKSSKAETSKETKRAETRKKETGSKTFKARSASATPDKTQMGKTIYDSFLDELVDIDFDFGFSMSMSMATPAPTLVPSAKPTATPTSTPTLEPVAAPTPVPTAKLTPTPTIMSMTREPVAAPTPVPSMKPTPTPTITPTASPSSSPSFVPTPVPTPMPSEAPILTPTQICNALPREVAMLNFLEEVTDVSLLTDPSTPQGMAYRWLLDDDPLQVNPCLYETLLQRYALATFIFSTTETSPWDEDNGWLSAQFECNWFNVTCAGGDLVTEIFLGKY